MVSDTHMTVSPAVNPIRRAWSVVRDDWRAFITLNIIYFGLVAAGMVYVTFINPGLQEALLKSVGEGFSAGPLAPVADAYTGGNVISAMLLTFVVNLFLGSVIQMQLTSMIIPFSGMVIGIVRAILWGLILSPSNPALAGPMIPHSLVLLLEGEGYVLAMLAAYIHSKAFVRPQSYGIQGHLRGYVEGLRRAGWVYLLVALILAAAAIYEAIEVIYIAPLFA